MASSLPRRFPALTAAALYAVVIGLAFWPFWQGKFLVNPMSDARTGYPVREYAAEYLRTQHAFPEWTPYTFGGMPFVANTAHGDTFYPTFLLRLVLPPDVGITLGFMLHLVLAGVFMFLFLRGLRLEWGPAFVGGAAYLMSGQVVSLVSPGHDGKLFVSALLPLALLCLYRGVTRGSWRSYLGFGVTVGFALISPHFQLTYYLLMAAGFFWFYLVFMSGERGPDHSWGWHTGLFAGGLVVGFALAAVQLLPFLDYLRFSPRGAAGSTSTGWDYATGWSMPPEELLGVLWPAFMGVLQDYWGRNPFKLHSEYAGVVALMLATFSFRLEGRKRLAWFFVFLGVYGALFAFGGYTPFYRIPYHLLPGIRMTRAPSMIFFLTSFSLAALAAMGLQALLAVEDAVRRRRLTWWAAGLGAATLLALAGGFRPVMEVIAIPDRFSGLITNEPAFKLDAARVLVLSLITLALCWRRLPETAWGLALGGLVLLDLWSVERHFIQWTPPARESFAADGVVQALRQDASVYRVLPYQVYDENRNYLMAHRLRSVLGYNGQELHRYDELLGGKNVWQHMGNPALWRLLAVKYLVLPQPLEGQGIVPVAGPVAAHDGQQVYVYRFEGALPFAYLVPEAVKTADDQMVPTLVDPRFDPRRYLLVPEDGPVGVTAPLGVPEPIAAPVSVGAPHEGHYRFSFAATAAPAYLFISENYYPDWHASVDGKPAEVVRAQYSMMAVPVPAGATSVELSFASAAFRRGHFITLGMLAGLLVIAGTGIRGRREAPGG